VTPRRCDFSECEREAFLWNRFGEWACGKHQNWLARKRDAKAEAA
jgi:hypothetical protein